jgi:hypothetical protein
MNRAEQIAVIGKTLENADAIVSAFLAVGEDARIGFVLASCCATVEDESGGRNVFGSDPWNEGSYPKGAALPVTWHGTKVTRLKYTYYKLRRNRGMQPNGVSICQLTSESLQIEAENLGGCWKPKPNAIVGFHFLKELFQLAGGPQLGYERYNGSGPAAVAYGERLMANRQLWIERLGD